MKPATDFRALRRSIEKRHRYNQRVGAGWLGFAVFTIAALWLISDIIPTLTGGIQLIGFFVLMIGTVLIARNLKEISHEEKAIEHLIPAFSALEENESMPDEEQLELAAKELHRAANGLSTFASGSKIYGETVLAYVQLRKALRNKLPYLIIKEGQTGIAKEQVGRLISILTNPSFAEVKAFVAGTAELPEEPRPPPRRMDWSQLAERRSSQIAISAVVAFALPPVLLFAYGRILNLDVLPLIRENLIVFLGIELGTFVSLFGILAQITKRGAA
jgi:hypothetical protein